MFCSNCGTYLENGVKFCPNCGTQIAAPQPANEPEPAQPLFEEPAAAAQTLNEQPEEPVYREPVYQQPETPAYQQPVVQESPAAAALSTPILIFGILGIAFACTFYLSFLGIIFSAIAKGKVKQYLAEGGVLSGKAKVGNILAKVGLIVGIILAALFVLWLIVMIIAAVTNGYSSSSRIYW